MISAWRARSSARWRPVAVAFLVLAAAGMVQAVSVHRSAATGGGVTVSVGYADDLRARPTFFPTPWEGDDVPLVDGEGI